VQDAEAQLREGRGDDRTRRLRHELYRLLESQTAGGGLRRVVDATLIALILSNAALVLLDEAASPDSVWAPWLWAFEHASVALFTVEYACRIWIAVEHDAFHHLPAWKARIRYLVSAEGVIDLLSILPYYLGAIALIDLRYLRLLRLFRLLKLSRYSPALQSLAAAFYQERRSFLGALLILIVALLSTASLMHLVEGERQPDAFGTLTSSMWWAIVTLTTVGYGDVVPQTGLGKVVGGASALLGLCLFALPSAIMASAFVEQIKRRDFVVNAKLVMQVPLFANVGVMHLVEIASMLRPRTAPPLYTVVRKGDPADCMYFILSGELQVELSPSPVRLSSGDFFGEMGLLNRAPRSASVTAVTDTQLLVLEDADFNKLMRLYPDMRAAIEARAAERVQATKR
jgi:voltage-gated potassium channel